MLFPARIHTAKQLMFYPNPGVVLLFKRRIATMIHEQSRPGSDQQEDTPIESLSFRWRSCLALNLSSIHGHDILR